MPPANRLISQIRATIAAAMKSQWSTKPPATSASAMMSRTINSIVRSPPLSARRGGCRRKTAWGPCRLRRDRCEYEHRVARLRDRERELVGAGRRRGVHLLLLARADPAPQRRLRAERVDERILQLGRELALLQVDRVLRVRAGSGRHERDDVLDAAHVLERVERELEDLASDERTALDRRLALRDGARLAEPAERVHDAVGA